MHRPLIGLYKLEDLSLQIGFPLDFRDWLEVDFRVKPSSQRDAG